MEVCSLQQLSVLSVRNNILASLPPHIGLCSALAVLDLRGNLIQHLPLTFSSLPSLR